MVVVILRRRRLQTSTFVKKNLFFTFGENSSHMTAQKRRPQTSFSCFSCEQKLVWRRFSKIDVSRKKKKTKRRWEAAFCRRRFWQRFLRVRVSDVDVWKKIVVWCSSCELQNFADVDVCRNRRLRQHFSRHVS